MNEKYSPSFLDRLIDSHGRTGGDHHVHQATLAQIKDNVGRDLEALLNTRHGQDMTQLAAFPNSKNSILSFGIADFSSQSLANPNHRQEICRSIEQAIHLHEPRLKQVEVSLSVEASTLNRLHFVIKALLMIDRGREHVSFDALLQPLTLQYSITQGHKAGGDGRH